MQHRHECTIIASPPAVPQLQASLSGGNFAERGASLWNLRRIVLYNSMQAASVHTRALVKFPNYRTDRRDESRSDSDESTDGKYCRANVCKMERILH